MTTTSFATACLVIFGWAAASGQVVINEVCPANADINYDPQYYNFTGWVELYNAGNANVNIGGYYLSDDITVKNKWRIPNGTTVPAKGFMLIWCDDMNNGLHTSFSMDTDGEDLVLSNGGGSVVDQIV
ncbi:MAG TPA: lamin tail domain-containing protein, partial [Ohtaekwangia sp.]|nr:lamin tail domain-containing protein [Ohtaekwangia sp.]